MEEKLTTIGADGVEATVSSHGAQLMSLVHDGLEYLWQGDGRWWPRRAPVLFPIVGALRDNVVQTPEGPAPMAQHGLARNFDHEVVAADAASVTYRLASSEETRRLYPYDFELLMIYAVADGSLSQTFSVSNTGDVPMTFQLGGHPAFNVPVDPASGERFDDYVLEFAEPWRAVVPRIVEGGLLDWTVETTVVDGGTELPIDHRLFDHDALVLSDVPGRTVTLRGTKSGRSMTVDFPGFDYCGIWSAAGDAPFVAIEPWTGTATGTEEGGTIEEKRGAATIAPGERFERTFTMTPR